MPIHPHAPKSPLGATQHWRRGALRPAKMAPSPTATNNFAGAIATELSHDVLKVNPFVPIVLLWIGAFIRDRSTFF